MIEETRQFVKGYETNTITTFRKFRGLMLDLLRGYPEYEYFGKFESVFPKTGKKVVEILTKDKIIELSQQKEGEPIRYRLTHTGINLAISITNLEYSENIIEYSKQTLNYSKEMRKFTITIIILGTLTLILGTLNLLLSIL